MVIQVILFLIDIILINVGFLASFLIRYGLPLPKYNFLPYKKSLVFLTLIYVSVLAIFGVYKRRFKSSWDLFKRIFSGLVLGTLLSVAFVYVFRSRWGAFPTGIFIISFLINLVLIFKLNQYVLKTRGIIRKRILIIGDDDTEDVAQSSAVVEKIKTTEIGKLITHTDIDEIVICQRIQNAEDLSFLIYLIQRLKADVFFSPSIYMELLSKRINGEDPVQFLNTFVGKKRDAEEFFIRVLDIIGSFLMLLVFAPVMILISLLIKISSAGPVIYKQKRVGKDGHVFTLYKFRTMIKDAEKTLGPVWASSEDPRKTKVGKILRMTRLDELPQLFNVLCGDMSLVGPRPERPYFVRQYKALQQLRLSVKPGMTGLAQIRGFYDLKPEHKAKYDYLYIQKRSLLLNLYTLLKTISVVFSKKGQ
jgi:lipopolysaccharide/colanic/teichoic acid biosynthesis glycosyltransferase